MVRAMEKKDMFEIKITLDATHNLLEAIRAVADALAQRRDALPDPEQERIFQKLDSMRHDPDAYAKERTDVPETAPESRAEAIASEAPAETPAADEEPKKRKPRAKKQAEQEEATKAVAEEPKAEPAVEEPKAEPAVEEPKAQPAEEAPSQPVKEEIKPEENDEALAGKGQTGDILSELTQKAIGDLDRLGVSRSDANRRIREYCGANGIKIPTFPALLQAVGYAAALDICKG